MKRRLIRFLITSLTLVALCTGLLWYVLTMHVGITENTMVFIPRNASIRSAVDSVNVHCKLPTPSVVSVVARIVARVSGKRIQSGWYVFTESDIQLDVLNSLFSGHRRPTVRVTIPEGLTYKEIAAIISRTADTDSADFIHWCDSTDAEGYLMPETYDFFWREDAYAIGERLHDEWDRKIGSLSPTKDAIILASIVQAEAAQKKEMSTIAGVYHNRLKRGMKLEADPTVQYGIGKKRRVLYRDLANDDNPWNTYIITGLPPTPINNPGVDAVHAAMNPEKHNYLFFVAKGGDSKEHLFATTGSQHMENVRRYRSQRR